ncbi:SusC/RagA family TonB-linked outer membrane protein [Flavobacterium mesophilum]|uniref:SusC/RagA family TonB-linked outer membrane protein n=1 Tax=Flavobacterium mesophilum TaxID=3143495 RepID=UPI0031E1370A
MKNSIRLQWLSNFKALSLFMIIFFCAATGYSQNEISISGKITDANSLSLPGANVLVKGTKTVTTTDFDGNFSIKAPSNGILVISFIGYQSKEIAINSQKNISVKLAEEASKLNEIVVVGYGTQKKGDLTSAVAHVTKEDFVQAPVKDVGQLLQGKVAGLTVTSSSGNPDSGSSIFLRGTSSISNPTPPLILIDGIPGGLKDFAPEDIETIDILKDGSAAAIYGTRANNGVLLITTKKGSKKDMKPEISFQQTTSTQSIMKKPNFLNADEYRDAIKKGIIPAASDKGASTDWIDEITQGNISTTYDLSIRGGNSKTNYYGSVNYRAFEGIMMGSDNNSLYTNINVNHKMFDDKLQVTFGINNQDNVLNVNSVGSSFNGVIYRNALIANPTAPVLKPEGANYAGDYYENFAIFVNPVADLKNSVGERKTHRTRSNLGFILKPIDGLTFNLSLGRVTSNTTRGYYENKFHSSNLLGGLNGYANKGSEEFIDQTLDFTAQYEKTFGSGHHLTGLLGYSYFDTEYESSSQYAYNFATDYFTYNNMGAATNFGPTGKLSYLNGAPFVSSYKNSYNLIGGFARANYDYNGKYLLSGTIRREGSSKFIGSDNPWGTFWAVSGGWRLDKEEFLKSVTWLNSLKVRAGYGITGAAPGGYYLGLSQLGLSSVSNSFYYNGNFVQTLSPFQNPNPGLTWEEKKETNIGLDFGMFNSRFTGTIDVYNRKTDGLLFNFPVPQPPNLVGTTFANAGVMENKGIEVSLGYNVIQNANVTWNAQVNGSYNENKFVSFSDDPRYKSANDYADFGSTGEPIQQSTHRLQIGQPVGNFYGFKVIDITDQGKWVYDDLNKDGKITNDDRQILGNGIPKYNLAFNNTVKYKNLDFTVTMRGAFDYQILNFDRMFYEQNGNVERNRLKTALEPVFGKAVLTESEKYNSYYIENGDYWKIDNIVLGYTFKGNTFKFFDVFRIYASTLNTFLFTKYKGLDPELSPEGVTPGNDYRDKYPTTRTFTIGINATF